MVETYHTAIGKVLLETDWDTLCWFFDQRVVRGTVASSSPVAVRVNRVPRQQVEEVLAEGNREKDANPGTVQVQDAHMGLTL